MKMLMVGNGWLLEERGRAVVGPRTAAFLDRCADHFDDLAFLCSSPLGSAEEHGGDALDPARVRAIPLRVRGARRYVRLLCYVRNVFMLWNVIRRADFLYVFFPGNLSLLCTTMARMLHKPYGVYLRGEAGIRSRRWQRTIARAQFVLACGNTLADAARTYCDDVELVVPMCPLPKNDSAEARAYRSQPPWRLLYVGRLETRKGTQDLIEAAAILRERGVDFRLDLVGQNCLGPTPPRLADLGECVNLIGVVRDEDLLSRYYTEADLFCFPSHDEGFPRVLYEAMAHGLPIVTTFVGSIPGIMVDGVNCLRIEPRSPVMLADAIQKALADVDMRRRLADRGRVTVEPILRRMREESHDTQLARKVAAHTPTAATRP